MSTIKIEKSPFSVIGFSILIIGIFGIFLGFMFFFTGNGRDYLPAFDMYRDSVSVLLLWGGIITTGIGGWLISKKWKKQEEEKLLTLSDGLKKESEINLGSPNKSSSIQLNQIWRGGDSVDVNQKGLFNFYDDSFSVNAEKLKGKIIYYKYDDVISQTDKAGIMTLPQQIIFFYTNDDNGYVIEFDSVADKLVFVDKCKHLGVKKDDVVKADSSADELKKFKELLDLDAITQEEFDAKKKELLGL